jgi:septal ring factor EnvC (AmiA/AmiB activator)
MPTQEERLSVLERNTATWNAVISDVTHNETMLLGMVMKQEENIREIKASLAALNEHLSTFEQSANSRFDEHTALLTQHTTLLTQILARLPEKS